MEMREHSDDTTMKDDQLEGRCVRKSTQEIHRYSLVPYAMLSSGAHLQEELYRRVEHLRLLLTYDGCAACL